MDQVRRQGWCVLDQELELGVMSVAAPVKNAVGQVVAAVNVSFQALAVAAHPDAADHLAKIRAEVVATARLISADMAAQRAQG